MQPQPLSKPEAEQLALTQLKCRHPQTVLTLAEAEQSEPRFGWVFLVSATTVDPTRAIPRQVIVNKYSAQVVASSIEYEIGEFIKRYEILLAKNQRDSSSWCGTVGLPIPWRWWRGKSVAERAKEEGFYEIRGREEKG